MVSHKLWLRNIFLFTGPVDFLYEESGRRTFRVTMNKTWKESQVRRRRRRIVVVLNEEV